MLPMAAVITPWWGDLDIGVLRATREEQPRTHPDFRKYLVCIDPVFKSQTEIQTVDQYTPPGLRPIYALGFNTDLYDINAYYWVSDYGSWHF